jgi:hypothetical protein
MRRWHLVPTQGPIAGAVRSLRAAEVARRELTDADIPYIVREEMIERRAAADQ